MIMFSRILNKNLINGMLFSLFSFIEKGFSFILLLILANYISPIEYGFLNMYTTYIMLLSIIIGLSSSGYLSQSYFQKDIEEFRKDVSIVIIITFFSALIISILVLLFNDLTVRLLKLPSNIIYLGILFTTLNVFYQINLNIHRLKEQVYKYGIISCTYSFANFVLAIFLVVIFSLGWKGKVYASIYTEIIFFIGSFFFLYKNKYFSSKVFNLKHYKNILYWSIPLIPHLSTTWLKQGCDRYIIENNFSMNEVGLFSFALNISNIIIIFGTAFNNTNSVNIYKILSDKNIINKTFELNKETIKIFIIYLVISLIILLSGILFIPIIFPLYIDSIKYFIILSISCFMQCIYFLYCNYLFYFGKTVHLMYITFFVSIIHLILSLFFTKYSILYTCLIYIISQSLTTLIVYLYYNKLLKKQINSAL